MSRVWDLDIPSHLKLVLLAIADHANDDGWAYPGQKSLGVKCSIKPRQVRANIAELEQRGLLERHRRGSMRTNLYRVTVTGSTPPVTAGGVTGSTPPPDRYPTTAVTGSPQPPNHQRTTREPPAAAVGGWVEKWAALRGVPLTGPVRRTWERQVQAFVEAGGEPSDQLLRDALDRGIEQPVGWSFAVSPTRWPPWIPGHLLAAATQPDRPVDPRWAREYDYGPHTTPPDEKLAVIIAKSRLMDGVRHRELQPTEQVVRSLLEQSWKEVVG